MPKIQGLTLIELLVTLAIMAMLATVTLPFVSQAVKRSHESELKSSLREVRFAIDRFHEDWRTGKISKLADGVSESGFPKTLPVLVDGVESGTPGQVKQHYLRRIPVDPFADQTIPVEKSWKLRSYNDNSDSATWGGQDVYDISSQSEDKAIDGSIYKDW